MSETTSSEWSTDSDTVSTLSATDTILDTASSVSQTSGEEDQEAEPELEISVPSAQPVRTPEGRQRILDTYLSERAKFFKHIKRRAKKFEKKSREDYDRARWGREPVKKPKPVKAAPAAGQNGGEMNRLASAAASAARAESSRAFATSSTALGARVRVVMKGETLAEVKRREKFKINTKSEAQRRADSARRQKKKAEKDALLAEMLTTDEAIGVLQAVEAAHPSSTFGANLTIGSKGSVPNLRGRAHLPYDIKATADVVVVFAEENSESAKLAREAGVQYVGGTEMFEEIEAEEIRPTKVLSTPGMLPAVTQRLGRFLGQRGLMPTTRRGGVGEGPELVKRIQEARGATDWLTDDTGSLQINFGRNNLAKEQMIANFRALISSVRAAFPDVGVVDNEDLLVSRIKRKKPKPTTWFEKVYVGSTGGPRIRLSDADSAF